MARRSMTALLFALLGCAAASARADECADAAQHFVIARRASDVGDFARAIAEYKLAYEHDGRTETLLLLVGAYEGELARLRRLVLDDRIPIFDDSDQGAFQSLPVFDDGESRR